jgi:hypothetical protein
MCVGGGSGYSLGIYSDFCPLYYLFIFYYSYVHTMLGSFLPLSVLFSTLSPALDRNTAVGHFRQQSSHELEPWTPNHQMELGLRGGIEIWTEV